MALLIYFVVFLLSAFVWRSLVVYKRSGQNPLVLPARDDAYGTVGRAFKILIVVVAAIAGEVLMQVQVRLEEAHLQSLHGAQYTQYSSTVRRWL